MEILLPPEPIWPVRGAQGSGRPPTAGHGARSTQLLGARCSRQPAEVCLFLRFSVPFLRGLAQSSRYSKLEKADILEMTVRFLQELPASSGPTAAPSE